MLPLSVIRFLAAAFLLCILPGCALSAHSTVKAGAPAPDMSELWAEPDAGRDLFGGPRGSRRGRRIMRNDDGQQFPGRLFVVEGIDGSGNAQWVRNLYQFAVTPTIGFYFRVSVDEAVKRIVGGRDAISYYEAGELKGTLIVVEGADGVGRSTHIGLLREWFEHTGHAVLDTGMTRSALAGKGLQAATEGNTLGPIAMSLLYATDFADRLENEIIPARRVVQTTGFNYWESGMDLNLGSDMYDSFLEYQGRLLAVFRTMSAEYEFHIISTEAPIEHVCEEIKTLLDPLFAAAVTA